MADNLTTQSTTPATVPASTQIATDEVASVHYQRVKLVDGTLDSSTGIPGDATNGLDVDVTRVQGTVNVSDAGGSLTVDDGGGSLTVDGTVSVSGTVTTSGTMTGTGTAGSPSAGVISVQGITSGTPLAVSGTVTASGPLTDTQLRATAVPVSIGSTVTTTALTDTQLRATAVPVSVSGVATAAKQPALGTAGTPSTDVISIQGVASGTTVPVSDGAGSLTVDNNGTFQVQVSNTPSVSVTGTPTVSISGTPTVSLSGTSTVTQTPATSGGLSTYRMLWGASTFPTGSAHPKSSAGQVFGWVITNTSASVRYVKFYSLAGTNPTLASDVPKLTIMVPGNTSGAGVVAAEFVNGIAFASGISLAVTTGIADTDTTAPGANEVIVNLMYK